MQKLQLFQQLKSTKYIITQYFTHVLSYAYFGGRSESG